MGRLTWITQVGSMSSQEFSKLEAAGESGERCDDQRPVEGGKGKQIDSPPEPPEGTAPC